MERQATQRGKKKNLEEAKAQALTGKPLNLPPVN